MPSTRPPKLGISPESGAGLGGSGESPTRRSIDAWARPGGGHKPAPMRGVAGDGVTLAVLDEGEGRPVLLPHGFPDSSNVWRHEVPALVDAGMRVIAPDLRGFGESGKPKAVEEYAITRNSTGAIKELLLEFLG